MTNEPIVIRIVNLDIMRGLAAIVVVLFHYTVIFPQFYPDGKVIDFAFSYGGYGVDLFFVISGFVILMSLSRSQGAGFVKSRFIRLYPAYWISALITFGFVSLTAPFPYSVSIPDFLINLTMFQRYTGQADVDSVYWSLAYELGFYIFLYTIFQLRGHRFIEWIPVYMSAGAIFYHFASAAIPHPLQLLLMVNDYSHLFACGISLYLIRERGWSLMQVAVLATAPAIHWLYVGWDAAAICVLILASMTAACLGKWQAGAMLRPLLWLGSISYALYLTHQMAGYVLLARLQLAGISAGLSLLITLGFALAIAHAVTYYLERPAASWLKKKMNRPR